MTDHHPQQPPSCSSFRYLFSPPLLLLLLFISAPTLIIAAAASTDTCHPQGLSFERCTSSKECAQLDGLFTPASCRGRDSFGKVHDCGAPNVNITVCTCRPFDSHYCHSSADCLDGMYCAESVRSGNKLCVGCQTHYDTDIGRGKMFAPLNRKDTDLRCRAWRKKGKGGKVYRPPCGRGGDFCSVSLPCSKDYACVDNFDSSLFKCSWESTRCRCALPALIPPYIGGGAKKKNKNASPRTNDSPVSQNNIMFHRCSSDCDCPSKTREVCVPYTTKGNDKVCISCDYALVAHDIGPLSSKQKRKCTRLSPRRAQPKNYVLGPNGRAMDRCRTFKQCRSGYSCVREQSGYDFDYYYGGDDGFGGYGPLRPLEPCNASPSSLCFCKPPKPHPKCKSWRDCMPGETCVNSPRFNLSSNCASTAFLHALSSDKYELLGSPVATDVQLLGPTPAGPETRKGGLTGDRCKYDWDCKGIHRRCTHVTDLYGRCAGRSQCYCQPLFKRACNSVSDCTKQQNGDKGETCATTIGTNSRPFCMSSSAVSKSPYFFPVDNRSPSPSSSLLSSMLPSNNALTGEPCKMTKDCKLPRTCVHRFDTAGECDGSRKGCVCKNVGMFARRQAACGKTRPYCKEKGEVCTRIVDEVPRNRVCVSRMVVEEKGSVGVEERVVLE